MLGMSGSSAIVRRCSRNEYLYIFKGIFFGDILEDRARYNLRKTDCYIEIRLLHALLDHPNIIPPSKIFVAVKSTFQYSDQSRICGTLTPYLQTSTLDAQITKINSSGVRLSPFLEAKW